MTAPTLLVATWQDGLFALRDGAIVREVADGPVAGLAADGRGGALLVVGGHELRRRAPDGTWTVISTDAAELSASVTIGETVFVGTNDARVLHLEPDGRLVALPGFDAVAGRHSWYAGTAVVDGRVVGPPLGVRSMGATSDGGALLVNVHVGGIPRSTDGGVTWAPTVEVEADVHQVVAHPTRPELAAAATARGLALSRDAGATWAIEADGLHAPHCSAVAFVGDAIWVSASTDPFAKASAVYARSIAGAGPLRRVASGLPAWFDGNVDTGNIAARGDDVAVADTAGHVYRSRDRGASWAPIADGLPYPTGLLFV